MHRVLLAAFVFLSLPAAAQTTGATPLGPGSLVMKKGGPDGIVMFRVTVSEAGTVSGYELMEEYPKGKMLSPGQAEAHMRSLRFKPAFKDGVPVAEETEEVITRDQTGSTRIRSGVMDAIKSMLASSCTVIRDGKEQRIDPKILVPGDLVRLGLGDRVPADLRIIATSDLKTARLPAPLPTRPLLAPQRRRGSPPRRRSNPA